MRVTPKIIPATTALPELPTEEPAPPEDRLEAGIPKKVEEGWRYQPSAAGPAVPLGPWSFARDPARNIPEKLATERRLPPETPLKPYLRSVQSPVMDAEYLRTYVTNAAASIEQVLAPALRSGELFSQFPQVLKAQHQVLVGGPGGDYRGLWGQPHQYPVPPGKFIYESGQAGRPAYTFGLGSQHAQANQGVVEGPLHLQWLPPEALPRLRIVGLQLVHDSPPVEHMPRLLERMAALLRLTFENLDKPESIQYLSDYFHAASHSHLFVRGNNSLFMGHVNYALERMGLNPIAHGGLDLAAMRKHYTDFRTDFYAAVRAENPGV